MVDPRSLPGLKHCAVVAGCVSCLPLRFRSDICWVGNTTGPDRWLSPPRQSDAAFISPSWGGVRRPSLPMCPAASCRTDLALLLSAVWCWLSHREKATVGAGAPTSWRDRALRGAHGNPGRARALAWNRVCGAIGSEFSDARAVELKCADRATKFYTANFIELTSK